MTDLIGNMLDKSYQNGRISGAADNVVSLVRATSIAPDKAIEVLGISSDIRAAVAGKVAERLATKQ